MTDTAYHLHVDPTSREHPDTVNDRLAALERWMEPHAIVGEPLEDVGLWLDYAQMVLLGLILVTLVVIAVKL